MTALLTDEQIAERLKGPARATLPSGAPSVEAVREMGARQRGEKRSGDVLGNMLDDNTLAKLGFDVEAPRFRQPENMTPLEKVAALHASGGPGAQVTEGIDLRKRLGAGFKFDRQSVYNYLRETYGGANVAPVRNPDNGSVQNFVVQDKDGRVKIADPEGFEAGDIADVGRDVAELGPGVIGGIAGAALTGTPLGGVIGSAIGDAVGSTAVQAVGKSLPGSEAHVSTADRLISGGVNVAAGAAIPVGGAILGKGGRVAQRAWSMLPDSVPLAKSAGEAVAKREIGKKLGTEALEQSSKSFTPKTVSSYYGDSQRIVQNVNEALRGGANPQSFLYHVTPAENDAAIAKQGLRPDAPKLYEGGPHAETKAVFLGDEMAAQTYLDEFSASGQPITTYRVAKESVRDVKADPADNNAWMTPSSVPAKNLEKLVDGKWVPVVPGGDTYALTAGKMTGSKYALGVERTLAQTPDTMEKMALQAQRELVGASRYADTIVNHVAANPEKLGNAAVGGETVKAINRHVAALVDARSSAARPLYEQAEQMFGGARIVPTDATRGEMEKLIAGNKFGPSKITAQMKASLGKIEGGAATDTGRLSVADMQNLRAMWGEVARGDKTIVEGLSTRNQKRMAKNVLRAIDQDLDAATKGIQGEAAVTLQKANKVWAEHSTAINDVSSQGIVKRVLKLGADSKNEQVVKAIGGLEREQLRGLMNILEKADADGAANLRAQLLANVFESGGKPQASTEFGRQLIEAGSESGIRPKTLQKAITRRGDFIGDLFGNDVVTRGKVVDMVGLLDRLGAGPGWAGSDTVPKGIFAGMMGVFKGVAPGVAGQGIEALQRAFSRGVMDPEVMLRIMADPDAAATAHVWLKPMLNPAQATPSVIGESTKALAKLTALFGRDETMAGDVVDPAQPSERAPTSAQNASY